MRFKATKNSRDFFTHWIDISGVAIDISGATIDISGVKQYNLSIDFGVKCIFDLILWWLAPKTEQR